MRVEFKFISILCFVLYFFYKSKNKTIDNKSSILQVETQASLVDGFLSLGIGLVFIIIWRLPANSSFDFLNSIGDAIIVLIMCLIFFTLPLKIIKESFIELGGGMLQDTAKKEMAEKTIIQSGDISGDVTITLPTTNSATLADLATAQTFTNKNKRNQIK